jgi:phosphotransferase system HPr-like phosphotransfer protein
MTLSDKTSGTIKSKSLVELLNHKVELKKKLIELKRDTNKSEELVKELSDAISDIEIFLSKHRIQK